MTHDTAGSFVFEFPLCCFIYVNFVKKYFEFVCLPLFYRRKNTDSSENDNNYETDDKSRPGACRIARTPVHEDAVVHLSAVQPGLCLSCSKDKVHLMYSYIMHIFGLNILDCNSLLPQPVPLFILFFFQTAALYDYDNHNLIDRWEGHERELTKVICLSFFKVFES